MNPELITYFGETDSRSRRVKFGIKAKDRTRHVYVIGKTGMGKSTLLENMAIAGNMHVGKQKEDCEHRSFHFQAIRENNAQIRISPLCLFE